VLLCLGHQRRQDRCEQCHGPIALIVRGVDRAAGVISDQGTR
jgi:hypothetical protein